MTRVQAWLLHVANILVGGTGAVYAVMLYFLTPEDEFAVVNHPWQPHAQHLHVLFAPLLVFAVGIIWQSHTVARWRKGTRPRRTSGLELMVTFFPMVASGYLLQVSVDEQWRRAWVIVHVTVSVLWLAGYLLHQISKRTVKQG